MTGSPDQAGLVVIGGGPAGHSAAAAYRTAGGTGRVVLISADDAAPYERPPLSKDFLRGETDAAELPMEPAGFYSDNAIELWLDDPVTRLDLAGRSVSTSSNRLLHFDACVLATGATPNALPVPGGDHPDIRLLRSLTDAHRLRAAAGAARTATVVGSGFIGCEAAASLALRGLTVTMLSTEELPQLDRLGRAAADRIKSWLTDAGVEFHGGQQVTRISDGRTLHTDDDRQFDAELVLVAAGVKPNTAFLDDTGLQLEEGRIPVDRRMATGSPGFFAAGDIAWADNALAGRRLKVEHWGEALRMGEIAGTNAAGGDDSWSEAPGFWSTIGNQTLKYAAWGDGYDSDQLVAHDDGGFTVWYSQDGVAVGVLTHQRDDDYERGRELIEKKSVAPVG